MRSAAAAALLLWRESGGLVWLKQQQLLYSFGGNWWLFKPFFFVAPSRPTAPFALAGAPLRACRRPFLRAFFHFKWPMATRSYIYSKLYNILYKVQ